MSTPVTQQPDKWKSTFVPSLKWNDAADSNEGKTGPDKTLEVPDMWSRMMMGTFCDPQFASCKPPKRGSD